MFPRKRRISRKKSVYLPEITVKVPGMEKNVIKEIIYAQQEFVSTVSLIRRKYELEPSANYVLVGLRRAGKTYLLYQYIQQLLAEGHKKEEILFINFEDERINDIRKEELHLLVEAYREMYDGEPFIFLDEIQNVKGWEHFVRRLADEKRRVFVTGSNAHMLSREIASTLGGRFLIKEVYPFSFKEYVEWKGIPLDRNWRFGPQKADVVRSFGEYLTGGGIAESFPLKDKRGWLTSLYQKILYSDVVVRNKVRNEESLSLLVKKLADGVLQPVSVKRLQNIVTGAGAKVTRETISTFLRYIGDAYVTFSLSNFTDSVVDRESYRKYYFYDNGILNLFLYQPEPKLLENVVAVALLKKYGPALYFYNRNVEVDFVVPEAGLAVQVCYRMSGSDTLERETAALVALNRFKPMKRNVIVTLDEEQTLDMGDLSIQVLPVWRWLLEEFG